MLVNIAAGIVIFFFMLLAINGYSESDAMWGLGVYGLLALIVVILSGMGALFMAGFLMNKQYGPIVCTFIAVPIFSVVGIALEIVSSFIGVGVAELVRVKF